MHSKKMVAALLLSMTAGHVLAEPAIQAGDTLESLSKVRISVTLQEPLAVEVDAPELEETAPTENVVVATAQSQTAVETASSENADVLEIDVPEVE
ncbi:hypothetical protein [Acinetobacter towneri]|uniref:hypothetical protein n=1 Tax=Acinetobacter towneri TaxID=202956 RepID=UPI002578685A|nr:hypothetical protein [Acinetobacter towneri]MDM1487169.1 hypothetical protein [Acinetobacter towneri]